MGDLVGKTQPVNLGIKARPQKAGYGPIILPRHFTGSHVSQALGRLGSSL